MEYRRRCQRALLEEIMLRRHYQIPKCKILVNTKAAMPSHDRTLLPFVRWNRYVCLFWLNAPSSFMSLRIHMRYDFWKIGKSTHWRASLLCVPPHYQRNPKLLFNATIVYALNNNLQIFLIEIESIITFHPIFSMLAHSVVCTRQMSFVISIKKCCIFLWWISTSQLMRMSHVIWSIIKAKLYAGSERVCVGAISN